MGICQHCTAAPTMWLRCKKTCEEPRWVHFGIGNIFRIFWAVLPMI